MRSNELGDADSTEHLLLWLGSAANCSCRLRTLKQLDQETAVADLLRLVDPKFFQAAETADRLDVGLLVGLLDQYLQSQLGRTIKTRYRSRLAKQQDTARLLGLMLYVCVHCQQRQRFICCILELPAETQCQLRQIIEQAGEHIENIMEIREILDKVEQLEAENDKLQAQLQQESTRNEALEERLAAVLQDYRQLEDEIDALKKEKLDVLRQLKIDVFDEYIELYRRLQAENTELLHNVQHQQIRNMQFERDRNNCQARIIDDGLRISKLTEDLERAKEAWKHLRQSSSFSCLDPEEGGCAQLDIDPHVLKENRMLVNLELSTSTSLGDRSKRNFFDDWTDSPCFLSLKDELRRAEEHCEELEEIAETQRVALEEYETENEFLQETNGWLRQQLTSLRLLHQEFELVVQASECS